MLVLRSRKHWVSQSLGRLKTWRVSSEGSGVEDTLADWCLQWPASACPGIRHQLQLGRHRQGVARPGVAGAGSGN